MDNEDTARFELLHPLGKRREMYKNCLKEWELAMSSTRWNPHPFKIEAILTAPGELDFYLEREAFRRAQFASFLHILAEKDMGLWFKFPELLFAPIRLEDEVIEPDKTFVARVTISRRSCCSTSASMMTNGRRALPSISAADGRATKDSGLRPSSLMNGWIGRRRQAEGRLNETFLTSSWLSCHGWTKSKRPESMGNSGRVAY